MPNHTANIITVTGAEVDLLAFIEKAKCEGEDGKQIALDFDNFFPMPEDLQGTTSPVKIMTQAEIDKQWEEWNKLPAGKKPFGGDKPSDLGITQEKHDELMGKYGCADWYEWAVFNWGTKWGAYSCQEWVVDGNTASLRFDTAWSPAIPFWVNVSEQYPNFIFNNEFADEGGGFVGYARIQNGTVEEHELDWDEPDGIELRKKLGYCHEEDEDEGGNDSPQPALA